jgi:hypothetical protein
MNRLVDEFELIKASERTEKHTSQLWADLSDKMILGTLVLDEAKTRLRRELWYWGGTLGLANAVVGAVNSYVEKHHDTDPEQILAGMREASETITGQLIRQLIRQRQNEGAEPGPAELDDSQPGE